MKLKSLHGRLTIRKFPNGFANICKAYLYKVWLKNSKRAVGAVRFELSKF